MEKNDVREIMEILREISNDQSALKERVESHLKNTEKVAHIVDEHAKVISRHDTIMKAAMWVVGFVLSGFGIRIFSQS